MIAAVCGAPSLGSAALTSAQIGCAVPRPAGWQYLPPVRVPPAPRDLMTWRSPSHIITIELASGQVTRPTVCPLCCSSPMALPKGILIK